MKTKNAIKMELRTLKKRHRGEGGDSDWRTGFEQGAMQALAWVLGDADYPRKGFELALLPKHAD